MQFTGRSSNVHKFDFLFQRTKNRPERLCKLLNNATKTNMAVLIFSWLDTKECRKNNSQLIVLINDSNSISKGVKEGLESYEIQPLLWSNKEQGLSLFR